MQVLMGWYRKDRVVLHCSVLTLFCLHHTGRSCGKQIHFSENGKQIVYKVNNHHQFKNPISGLLLRQMTSSMRNFWKLYIHSSLSKAKKKKKKRLAEGANPYCFDSLAVILNVHFKSNKAENSPNRAY